MTLPVVAVFNHKGGVAKTTTACNLAVCLAAHGWRVMLVDLDAQGNASASFGHLPLPAVGSLEVITDRIRLADALLPTPFPNLFLLPATAALRTAELELAAGEGALLKLRNHVATEETAAIIDMVVIDCPPSFGMVTLNALNASSAVLIPTRPDPFAHEGLSNTWYEVKRLRQDARSELAVAGILLTMTEERGSVADGALIIRAEFGNQVFAEGIPADAKVAEAAQLSLPVTVMDPDCPASHAYVAATTELLARLGGRAATAEVLLNTLREWRAGQVALERIPKGERGWVATRRTIGPEPPPAISPLGIPGESAGGQIDRHWLGVAFVAGALLGALVMGLLR